MVAIADFIVLDTEGKDFLNEIAVIDSNGKLIYEAFNVECDLFEANQFKGKSLKQIILDLIKITDNKLIVCHYAEHDCKVIQKSFNKAGIPWLKLKFACTHQLAKKTFPDFSSHSLEYLSKKLDLKVDRRHFNIKQAHTARYDAEFTYQLYCQLTNNRETTPVNFQPNPFGSSRVDNPFQSHPDLTSIHQKQFTTLKTILTDIKYDANHQSKGAVVIGEPGTGKTHLMMRFANELLEHNRLLFIRQPNNAETIIYHTYSRILESLVQKVANSVFTQLEYLLAKSFIKLLRLTVLENPNQKEQYILETTEENSLKIYSSLGAEGTQRKREYWQYIEKRTIDWWLKNYGAAGYSLEIIKGIIKFCSYSDTTYKRLVTRWLAADSLEETELAKIGLGDWNEDISKESFSLEAIRVLSKLSLLDEPLIIVFDQLEGLGLPHNQTILLNFGEAIKEIFTHVPNSLIILNLFPDRWQQFQQIFDGSIIDRISQHQVILTKPSPLEIKQILQTKAQTIDTKIDTLFSTQQLNEIISQNSIRSALNKAYDYYRDLDNIATKVTVTNNSEPEVATRLDNLEQQVSQLTQFFQNIARSFSNFTPIETREISITNSPPQDLVTTSNIFTKIFSSLRRTKNYSILKKTKISIRESISFIPNY